MARLFTDGAEFGDTLFWDSPSNIAAVSTAKRSGNYSYAPWGGNMYAPKTFTALDEIYLRVGIRLTFLNEFNRTPQWRSDATELGSIRINTSTQKIEIYTSTDTLVDTGDLILQTGRWYLIEIHIKIANAPDGVIEVKIDGITDASYTGDTKPGTETTINNIRFIDAATDGCYDDLAANDTSGAEDNSWCGDGHVILLTATANGDQSGLMGSDEDQTNNYLLVDDLPSDGDSTYVDGTGTNTYDLYNLAACGLSNVDILRVWGESRSRNTIAEGGNIALVLKTNGTEFDSSDISLLTSYKQCLGTVYTKNPSTTGTWSVADLDAIQTGPKTR